jgi:hypothetical protein
MLSFEVMALSERRSAQLLAGSTREVLVRWKNNVGTSVLAFIVSSGLRLNIIRE